MALTFTTTARRGLRWLTGSNLVSDIDAGFQALAEDVDAQLLTRSFGQSIIATAETRTNTAYGLMTTPDRVQSVVMPADGLIAIAYQAIWLESVPDAGRAAIFVGANQLKVVGIVGPGPNMQAARTANGNSGRNLPLASDPIGLVSSANGEVYISGDVATGQVVGISQSQIAAEYIAYESGGNKVTVPGRGGGVCYVFAAAGTYDISVQFKATSGSVTAHSRKLWVWSMF